MQVPALRSIDARIAQLRDVAGETRPLGLKRPPLLVQPVLLHVFRKW